MAFDHIFKAGVASRIVEVMLRDSSTGAGKTSVAFGGVTASYVRAGGTRQAIALAAGSAGDAYSSGKWCEIDAVNQKGVYSLHLPDAAIAAGADAATISLQASGVIDKTVRIVLIAADLYDGTALGLSRLDAAVSSRNATAPDNAGITAIKAKTDNLPASPSAVGSAMTLTAAYDAARTALAESGYTAPDNAGITAIKAKTDNLPASPAAVSNIPTADQNADALLKRDWTEITGEAARSVLNALRFLRNKWTLSGGMLTITKEDDSTPAWSGPVTTDTSAKPVTGVDPS